MADKGRSSPSIFDEATGVISGTGIQPGAIEQVSQDGSWWLMSVQQQATPIQSLYIWMDELPSRLAFGVVNGQPQFQVTLP